jgi:hypothetical protein
MAINILDFILSMVGTAIRFQLRRGGEGPDPRHSLLKLVCLEAILFLRPADPWTGAA